MCVGEYFIISKWKKVEDPPAPQIAIFLKDQGHFLIYFLKVTLQAKPVSLHILTICIVSMCRRIDMM